MKKILLGIMGFFLYGFYTLVIYLPFRITDAMGIRIPKKFGELLLIDGTYIVLMIDHKGKLPKGSGGINLGGVVVMDVDNQHPAMIRHEVIHTKQYWRTYGTLHFLMSVSSKLRLKYELEAYRGMGLVTEDNIYKALTNPLYGFSKAMVVKEMGL